MATYYLSPTGNDSNSGSQVSPWRYLQKFINVAVSGDILYITSGTNNQRGSPYDSAAAYCINKDWGPNGITIEGLSGNILECDSGFEAFGKCRYVTLRNINFRISASGPYHHGVYIDCLRTDGGRGSPGTSDGQAGWNITIDGCTALPIAGSGSSEYFSRGGFTVWGADYVTVNGCLAANLARDREGNFGGASSCYSFGMTRRKDTLSGRHWTITNNIGWNARGTTLDSDNDDSADRNGIILDLYHTQADYAVGETRIENNILMNVWGRGIHVLRGGMADAPIVVCNNTVIGPFATRLYDSNSGDNSQPATGIGGYAAGTFRNVVFFNNLVINNGSTGAGGTGPRPNYQWENYDAAVGALQGSNNWSYEGPESVFSPEWTEPASWLAGTTNPSLIDASNLGVGNYRPSSGSPLVAAGVTTFAGYTISSTDFYGQGRPATPSIGAAETMGTLSPAALSIQTTFNTPTVEALLTGILTIDPLNIGTSFLVPTVQSGSQVSTQDATYVFNTAGTYFVTHTASNAYGSGTITKQITVGPPAPVGSPPVANFTVSANPTQGSPVVFTNTSVNSPTSYLWNFGDSSTSTATSPSHSYSSAATYTVTLTATNANGSNIKTSQVTVAPLGAGGAGASCSNAPADFTVSQSLSLQSIIDNNNVSNKTIRIPAGTYDCGSYVLYAVNRDFGNVQIVADPNAILRGSSGIELYGQIRGFKMCGGIIEVNGGNVVGEGFFCDSNRPDKGANGNAGSRITLDNVKFRPIPGTGAIQRNGIAIWGCDMVTVRYCTVEHASSNSAFGFGGAGSGISIGHGRRSNDVGSPRVLIDHNLIHNQNMIQDGPSADRNGIILDLFHAAGGAIWSDYIIGDVIVSNNEIYDVSGRGIQNLYGGLPDSLVTISGNYVHGRYADDLGQAIGNTSWPVCGIGGYGGGACSNVLVTNNIVVPYGGHAAYQFISFDGAGGPGVLGSNNQGLPVEFENSRTNVPPSGFSS